MDCFRLLLQQYSYFQNAIPEVTLPFGVIRGREATTIKNLTYYAFEKVPYAAPPIDELRFQPPQPTPAWTEPLDTQYLDVGCYQQNSNADWETEDCLYLNIFTPQVLNFFNFEKKLQYQSLPAS